jgi:hypothetical protein
MPLMIFAGDGEFSQAIALHDQAAIRVGEIDSQSGGQVFQ